jgi:hypothetical protein
MSMSRHWLSGAGQRWGRLGFGEAKEFSTDQPKWTIGTRTVNLPNAREKAGLFLRRRRAPFGTQDRTVLEIGRIR